MGHKKIIEDLIGTLERIKDDKYACTCVALDWFGEGHASQCAVALAEQCIARAKQELAKGEN